MFWTPNKREGRKCCVVIITADEGKIKYFPKARTYICRNVYACKRVEKLLLRGKRIYGSLFKVSFSWTDMFIAIG